MKPEAILFDEPTSALDPALRGELLEVLRSLAREGMTMLVVTHDMALASELANRIWTLDDGMLTEPLSARDSLRQAV